MRTRLLCVGSCLSQKPLGCTLVAVGWAGGWVGWQPPPPPPAPSPSLVKIAVCKTIRLSQQVYGSLLQPFRASQPTGLTSVLKSGGITSEREREKLDVRTAQPFSCARAPFLNAKIPKVDHRFNIQIHFWLLHQQQHIQTEIKVLCSEMVIVFGIKLAKRESRVLFNFCKFANSALCAR